MARRWGSAHPDRRDWPTYNEQLVVRGEFFLDLAPFRQWKEELAVLNRGKRGGQFQFPPSFVRWLVIWKQFLDYRSLEGLTRRLAALRLIPAAADYTTLWHRLHGMTPEVTVPKFTDLELASDGSGLKTTNAGEYRIFRYGDPEAKRRKHLMVVITADVRRKKVIGIEAYVEGRGHSEPQTAETHLRKAVRQGAKVRKFYGDGAYDTNRLYEALHEMGTEPVVKVRRNMTAGAHHGWTTSKHRRRAGREYRRLGYRAWADTKRYGMRWPGTEGIFSAVKRKFGENMVARSRRGLVAEGYQRVWAYDTLREYGEARSRCLHPSPRAA